jgi:endonuclease/exonuclease/phosphatase family metal-dependent hydrolase
MVVQREVRVITHNVAGGYLFGGAATALDVVGAQIASWVPDIVMLEEMCSVQRDAFKAEHPTWNTLWVPRRVYDGCGVGSEIGQVLASPWPITNKVVHQLGYVVNGNFTLLVGDVAVPNMLPVRAHVTHLPPRGFDPDNTIRQRMTKIIADITNIGGKMVLGGDFNLNPASPELDCLYAAHTEADEGPSGQRVGDPTYNSTKIDYIFYSQGQGFANSGGVIDGGGSDHDLLRGRFSWTT